MGSPKKKYHPWARYRHSVGLTQEEVANKLYVTRHYVIRLEQSLYSDPDRLLVLKLAEMYGVEVGIFQEAYYQYVRDTREEFAKTHESFETYFRYGNPFPKLHPLISYRRSYDLSRMGFCKGLCLHYNPMSNWEVNDQRHIPEQLIAACKEINWKTEPLDEMMRNWRHDGYADAIHR